jgi:ribosomal protein S18 acetylase RimI-like enzyme
MTFTEAERDRLTKIETKVYRDLYRIAQPRFGSGWIEVDAASAVWMPGDEDPDCSCIVGLGDCADPARVVAEIEAAARAGGATILAVDPGRADAPKLGHDWLVARGFEPAYKECVWARSLSRPMEPPPAPEGVTLRRPTKDEADLYAWTLNTGFGYPPDHVRGQAVALAIGAPGWFHYLVEVDSEPAGASCMMTVDGVAHLLMAATIPAYRGRGAQRLVVHQRLLDGVNAGCDAAASITVADNASPRNMGRAGFELLHERWLYAKQLTS